MPIPAKAAFGARNQILKAIIFLNKQVLNEEIGDLGRRKWAKKPEKLPIELSKNEIRLALVVLSGLFRLIGQFQYGCGFKLMEEFSCASRASISNHKRSS